MKAAAIRRWLGVQNALLGAVAWPLAGREPRRILLYRTARIGDFVVTIPALAALRRRYPLSEIVLLTTTSTTASAESVGRSTQGAAVPPWFTFVTPSLVDRVVLLDGTSRQAMITQVRAAVREFRPDVAVLLSSNLETFAARLRKLLFFRLAGLRRPILGWRMRQSLQFDPHVQAEAGMIEHNVVTAAKSVHELPGMPPFDPRSLRFEMARSPEAVARIDAVWRELQLEGRQVVALFPGASFAHKRWPPAKYAQLARAILVGSNARIVVLGAESDREATSSVIDHLGDLATDLTGRLGLLELTEFLSRADLYVGSDTGPMHLSTAMGTPTIALTNGQELGDPWSPWSAPGYSLKHDVPCKGCYSFEGCPLGTRECIVDLPVERVIATATPLLRVLPAREGRT